MLHAAECCDTRRLCNLCASLAPWTIALSAGEHKSHTLLDMLQLSPIHKMCNPHTVGGSVQGGGGGRNGGGGAGGAGAVPLKPMFRLGGIALVGVGAATGMDGNGIVNLGKLTPGAWRRNGLLVLACGVIRYAWSVW